MTYIDLHYLGAPHLIATAVIETEAGPVLIDPGPSTALGQLTAGLEKLGYGLADVEAILLTHIHLDHAGATGTLVRHAPDAKVVVHRRGALHMERPGRLIASATQLYGDDMDRLWGAFEPVPAGTMHVVEGGETVEVGERTFEVAYTPGHARHHVSYFDASTSTAYVGDTVGMCVAGDAYVMPVTPPPDVDLAGWIESLGRLRAWSPEQLFRTHFGPSDSAAAQLDQFQDRLLEWEARVRSSYEPELDQEMQAARFKLWALDDMRRHVPEAGWPPYEHFGLPEFSWAGLVRSLGT
ncbi:MAG: MBL fold metallo-hydrolase [Bacteroidota bacterium]